MIKIKEYRSFTASELRVGEIVDGKRFLSGYAARYNVLSHDLGWGMYERLLPGTFKRAIEENQDVYHLINHDASQILGRTLSGTTVLSEDENGLKFKTLINEDDPHAVAFAARVARGDINQCSFAFQIAEDQEGKLAQTWKEIPDPEDDTRTALLREVSDVDLFDVSTVTYPAYPKTNTSLSALRADIDRIPATFRARINDIRDTADAMCQCQCSACLDGECDDCSDDNCMDENCMCSARSRGRSLTRKVDGEALPADSFVIVGDPNDPSTFKLPWKFSCEEKTKKHLHDCLNRFNGMKKVIGEAKQVAWDKLVAVCRDNGVAPSDDVKAKLTPEQIQSFDFDAEARLRYAKTLQIKASL